MHKIKQKFNDDPVFAVIVIAGSVVLATSLLKATADVVASANYARTFTNI